MGKRILLFFIAVILIASIAYLMMERASDRQVRDRQVEENKAKSKQVTLLKEKTEILEQRLEEQKEVKPPSQERMEEVFGENLFPPENYSKSQEPEEDLTPEEELTPPLDCQSLEKRILNFFAYLDKKNYPLMGGSYAYTWDVIQKLSERRPEPVEKLAPASVLDNSFHLYRATSKKDIAVMKEVLRKERDTMEQTMDYFYQRLSRCQNNEKLLPPMDVLYEYAHFFLNTMGGRAYLFRMDSNLRVMLLYYSALIIHEADLKEMNQYGLDIRPYLNRLEDELKSYKKLYFAGKYLDKVREIQKTYRPIPPT